MNDYAFLILSLLLFIPGAVVFWRRPDLRIVIKRISLMSIPFAFTEFLFYPDYWEPKTLFDLVPRIGFGIEDILFVVGLGAFTSTAYPFLTRHHLAESAAQVNVRKRAVGLLVLTFVAVGALAVLRVPMIYGSIVIMTVMTTAIVAVRRDLIAPSIVGSICVTVAYTFICLVLSWIIPEVFELNWNTEKFLNIFVLTIPLEEILYSAAVGAIATVFYPFVTNQRFVKA